MVCFYHYTNFAGGRAGAQGHVASRGRVCQRNEPHPSPLGTTPHCHRCSQPRRCLAILPYPHRNSHDLLPILLRDIVPCYFVADATLSFPVFCCACAAHPRVFPSDDALLLFSTMAIHSCVDAGAAAALGAQLEAAGSPISLGQLRWLMHWVRAQVRRGSRRWAGRGRNCRQRAERGGSSCGAIHAVKGAAQASLRRP